MASKISSFEAISFLIAVAMIPMPNGFVMYSLSLSAILLLSKGLSLIIPVTEKPYFGSLSSVSYTHLTLPTSDLV